MVTDNSKLMEDYAKVLSHLKNIPSVTILNVEGQPPDTYDIQYDLQGFIKTDDGSILVGNQHSIQIHLAFGYPHFPPKVKPLSSIFHPDITAESIMIGEEWEKNPILTDLITYIGRLIIGEIYSDAKIARNKEAAQWYAEQQESLPLDTLIIEAKDEDAALEQDGLEGLEGLDSILEETLKPLSLETNESPIAGPASMDGGDFHEKIEQVRSLVDRKELHAAHRTLGSIPTIDSFTDRNEIEEVIVNGLRQADKLLQKASEFEGLGQLDKAQNTLSALQEIITDAPGADDLSRRIENAVFMSLMDSEEDETAKNSPDNLLEEFTTPHPPEAEKKEASTLKKTKRSGPSFPSFSIPVKPLLGIACILALVSGAGLLLKQDLMTQKQAQRYYNEAIVLLKQKNYNKAEARLQQAVHEVQQMKILAGMTKELQESISTTLSSEELINGLKGHVLVDGKYINKEEAGHQQQLVNILNEAKAFYSQDNFAGALDAYQRALDFAQQKKTLQAKEDEILTRMKELLLEQFENIKKKGEVAGEEQGILEELAIYEQALDFAKKYQLEAEKIRLIQHINNRKLDYLLQLATQAEESGNWEEAAKKYREALALARTLTGSDSAENITNKLTTVSFHHELDLSKKAFHQKQWQQTVKKLQQAQQYIIANPDLVSREEQQDLRHLLLNAQLYLLLSNARNAYENKVWPTAIDQYQQAIQLVKLNARDYQGNAQEAINKIEKILLKVKITQINEEIQKAKYSKDLRSVLNKSLKIQGLVLESSFQRDPEIAEIKKKINKQIQATRQDLQKAERLDWLEKNYESIFRRNYNIMKGAELTNPEFVLMSDTSTSMTFTITCLEKGYGRPAKLELKYRYNKASKTWSVVR